jgi:preprotein translocase subunit SecG
MQQLQFLQTVLLVLQILVCVGLVAVILLQRSEGGALGMGGGGGGMMTARGAGNLLTRTTAILAVMFFSLSVGLVILGNYENSRTAIGQAGSTLKRNPLAATPTGPAKPPQPGGALPNAASNANSAGSLGDLETGAPIQLKPEGSTALSGPPATKSAAQPPAAKK